MQTSDADHFFRTEADIEMEERRRLKALLTKDIGEPIDLGAKVIDMVVKGNEAWTAESTRLVRRIDLETGKVLQVYKGHSGPVTCLILYECAGDDGKPELMLITGSWDKTIRVWNTKTKAVISETQAHDDFVKTLAVIPTSQILVSGSSDKTAKLWDLSGLMGTSKPLPQLASLSSHRRPVDSVAVVHDAPDTLVTGDSMGAIKVWSLAERWQPSPSTPATVKATLKEDFLGHSTGINDMALTAGFLWTASTDKTATYREHPVNQVTSSSSQSLEHTEAVKCLLVLTNEPGRLPYLLTGNGDAIRVYDISELLDEDDTKTQTSLSQKKVVHFLNEIDVHSQSVSSLQLWLRESKGGEPWIVSASLDGTLRRWKLADLVEKRSEPVAKPQVQEVVDTLAEPLMTEDEERELAELMGDND